MVLYTLGIRIYYGLIRFLSLWNPKANAWIKGRKKIDSDLATYSNDGKESIWFHCASLGEFEQGRPLIEQIKQSCPDTNIVLTFFSPSGYQVQKNYSFADLVTYLPRDYSNRMDIFITKINPKLVVIVKYEYWLNMFRQIDKHGVPRVLISSRFIANKYPLNLYGRLTIPLLKKMKYIFVQDESSKQLLVNHSFSNVILAGDTRVDRVIQIAEQQISLPKLLIDFVRNKKVLVCGSTWTEDEILIKKLTDDLPPDWCIIIAPHEIDKAHISKLKSLFGDAILMSKPSEGDIKSNVLIVDSIGILSQVYSLGTISYIGGAFKTGLHNILEPAAFGLPVMFGPKYDQFTEARDLVKKGAAFSVSNYNEFEKTFYLLCKDENRKNATLQIKKYMEAQKGSTMIIFNQLGI